MKKYLSVIIFLAILAFVLRHSSPRYWLYVAAATLATYISIFIVEKYRKLTSFGRYLIYLIVGVPILTKIIPLFDLVVLSATGLATTIYYYADDTNDKKIE